MAGWIALVQVAGRATVSALAWKMKDRHAPQRGPGVLTEEPFKDFVVTAFEVRCDISKDGGQSSNAEWGMLRDCQVMFAMIARGETKVTAGLAGDGIAELAEGLGEVASREIAGKPHTAMTSSRTWWSRTTLGDCPSSKWQRTASRIFP